MPVDFLTAEQTKRYGHFHSDPSPAQLAKYFFLDDSDRAEIASHRGAHNRLGYAVQLCTVRFLGAFLPDPLDVPKLVVQHLAEQLAITDPDCLTRYRDRRPTHHEHVEQIRQRHGYCDFSAQPEHWRLVRWLYTRAWLSAERPVVLFDLATARMVERKVLLPGATTLARLVASVSDRAAMRLWRSLAELPNRNQRKRLEGLLTVPDTQSVSALDRLRRASCNASRSFPPTFSRSFPACSSQSRELGPPQVG